MEGGHPTSGIPGRNESKAKFDWSRILPEIRDFWHVVDPEGKILYASPSCKDIAGYDPSDLIDRFIMDFLHPDDLGPVMEEFRESFALDSQIRLFYRFRTFDGNWVILESLAKRYTCTEPGLGNFERRYFIITARLYPTKSASLFDSFLELKIENERLVQRVAQLRGEEEASQAQEALDKQIQHLNELADVISTSGSLPDVNHPVFDSPLPLERTSVRSTEQNLFNAPISSHSRGGPSSPRMGDLGILITSALNEDTVTRRKSGKTKGRTHYFCSSCGTVNSPEWRKGPAGPKTLCNACGLRWSKQNRSTRKEPDTAEDL